MKIGSSAFTLKIVVRYVSLTWTPVEAASQTEVGAADPGLRLVTDLLLMDGKC